MVSGPRQCLKTTMFYGLLGEEKETSPSSAILEMYPVYQSCIIHGSCCISTMPTFQKGPGTGLLYVAPCHLKIHPPSPTLLVKHETFHLSCRKLPSVFRGFCCANDTNTVMQPFNRSDRSLCRWFHRFTERKAPDPGDFGPRGFLPM